MTVPETGDSPDVSVLANNFDVMDTLIYDHKQDGAEAAEAYLEDAIDNLTAAAYEASEAAIRAETAAGAVDQRLIPQVSATVTSVPYDPSSPTGGASVTQDGTTLQPQFHFSIPRGADGPGTLYLQNADPAQVTTISVVDAADLNQAVASAFASAGFLNQLGNALYPVGSIYVSTSSVEPGTLFGGTWRRIEGRFLLAATDNGTTGSDILGTANVAAGGSGGEALHLLTDEESGSPEHTHTFNASFSLRQGGGNYIAARAGDNTTVQPASSSPSLGSVWSHTEKTRDLDLVTINGGVGNYTANASEAHNNMPPFLAVYVWERLTLWVAPAPAGE